MSLAQIVDEGWPSVLRLLPSDLEQTAVKFKAIQRKRGVRTASDMLRLGLA